MAVKLDEGVEVEPDWDLAAQTAPDFDADQRVNWWQVKPAIQTCCGWTCVWRTRCIGNHSPG